MFISTNPVIKHLHNGFILRSVANQTDVENLACFNNSIHGDGVDTLTRELINNHPHTTPEEWFFIEKDGVIISTLCLISWTWQFCGVSLKIGEMGVVGTLAEYRGQGLVRELAKYHRQLLNEGGYHLSNIQGIPYFYRQFGYEYALPLEGGWRLDLHLIPDDIPDGFSFRPATQQDIPNLMRLYETAMRDLDIYAVRDEAIWNYLLGDSTKTEYASDIFCVLDADDEMIGYWRVEHHGFGEGLNINECSNLSYTVGLASLAQFKKLALERNKPYIKIHIPPKHIMTCLVESFGGRDNGRYAWQIMIPDVHRLLTTLKPVFEQRLMNTPFANLTHTFTLNLYRRAFALDFQNGVLADVKSLGYYEGDCDLSLPPDAFTQLVMGHRTRAKLHEIFPDVSCYGMAQLMTDCLFPHMDGFIYSMY